MALSMEDIGELITEIKDYQVTQGPLLKLVAFERPSSVPTRSLNVSVVPTPFPQGRFQEAQDLQPLFTELYVRAACDEEWLYRILKPLLKQDDFLTALWNIQLEVKRSGISSNVICGIFRSDYMLHALPEDSVLKQVEMNTFSVAGACHAHRVPMMHKQLQRARYSGQKPDTLPTPWNRTAIINALLNAHQRYTPTTDHPRCILMVVQPENFNVADERPIEYGLWEGSVACHRCDWPNVIEQTSRLRDGTLMFTPRLSKLQLEVSVVYYRAGYEAHEYDAKGRQIRLQLEQSRAIKCPDILTHLTTFKIVQQALTHPGAVERFLDKENATKVRRTFMPMYSLDDPVAQKLACNPDTAKDYVLKPNLEGGGHNIYGADIPGYLKRVSKKQWSMYTLMRMIEAPKIDGVLLTPEHVHQGPVISELGVLGSCLFERAGDKVQILSNEVAGWTFKTKPSSEKEISVVKGYGCFDVPRFMDCK